MVRPQEVCLQLCLSSFLHAFSDMFCYSTCTVRHLSGIPVLPWNCWGIPPCALQ